MPVFMANEVWQEVKRYVQQQDRADAADALVSVLIDNDVSAEEIKALMAAGLILFLLTLLVNMIADLIVNRSGRKGR